MKKIIYITSFISILFYTGCNAPSNPTEEVITLGGSDKIDTLNENNLDLKEVLEATKWKEIIIDLDKFYPTVISTLEKSYLIDMSFENGKLTAYADCQKLTAKYKIDKKEISFSRISYTPAIELASCQESKDADQAVNQFLSNTFEASKIQKDEIIFYSDNFETEIRLKQ